MNKARATALSWKTKVMPSERKLLDLDLSLSAAEYQQVQLGFVLKEMEDKWFIYFEDSWLNFYRSWTGNSIYRLRFEPSGNDYRVVEAWVNQNPEEYTLATNEYDRQGIRFLIDAILLDKQAHPPRREELRT